MSHAWHLPVLRPERRTFKDGVEKVEPAVHGFVTCKDCGCQLLAVGYKKKITAVHFRVNANAEWRPADLEQLQCGGVQ